MSLIVRLNLAAVILFLCVLLVGFVKSLHTAADFIQQEEQRSSELTKKVIDAQIQLFQTYPYIEVRPEKLPVMFHLQQFNDAKYLKIELFDSSGKQIAHSQQQSYSTASLPVWLKALLLHPFKPVNTIERDIKIGNMYLGSVRMSPYREAELHDVWFEVISTLTPVVLLFLLISLGMSAVVSFVIKPVVEFIKTVEQQWTPAKVPVSKLSRLHDLLGLSEHLKGISHELKDSTRKVDVLNHKILHLQEEERRRLSAELHDELGQHLTAIRFESAAIKTARNIEETQQSADAIDAIGREMKDIIRSMLERLRPPELESMGLQGAIVEMMGEWQLRHPQHNMHFDCKAEFSSLDDDEQLSLYRIVQEALTNISRHAGEVAVDVAVSLRSEQDEIQLRISDNGQGCDLNKHNKRYGLKGMRERVEGLSGRLDLVSKPGEGMTVKVNLPLKLRV